MSNLIDHQKKDQPRPGIVCPQEGCGFFIEISIPALLQKDHHKCPGCGLMLTLDRANSRESMSALSQLQAAIDNINAVKKGKF